MRYEKAWKEHYGFDRDPVRKFCIFPALKRLSLPIAGSRILDAGCGNGGLLTFLRGYDFASYVGIDRSGPFLQEAQVLQGSRVRFVQGDLLRPLPFDDQTFDLIFSIFVLNEISSFDKMFHQLRRVLHRNGKMVLVLTHPFFVLYHQLAEKFTGTKSRKLVGRKSYFATQRLRYVFTLADVGTHFYQHTFQELFATAKGARLQAIDLRELKTDAQQFHLMPTYWDTRDIPKYLIATLSRI